MLNIKIFLENYEVLYIFALKSHNECQKQRNSTMNWLVIFIRLAHKIRCENILIGFLSRILFTKEDLLLKSYEEARAYISDRHPDLNNSCICHHQTDATPIYDLQVVIPVYNTELYIEDCLKSVLDQKTHYSYIIDIVNDGSTDRSREIIGRYADDRRVRIIDQENKGLSGARNAAIQHSDARYILFLDSDDRLYEGAVEKLMNEAYIQHADIVEGGARKFSGQYTLSVFPHQTGTLNPNDFIGFIWGKAIRAQLFENLQFPLGYWFEDTIGVLLLYHQAQQRVGIKDIVYEYRKHRESITAISQGNAKILDTFYITRRLLKDVKQLGLEVTEDYVYSLLGKQIPMNVKRIHTIPDTRLQHAHFLMTCAMVNDFFGTAPVSCHNRKAQLMLKAIRTKDFRLFEMLCIY